MIKGIVKGFVAAGLGLALTVSVAEAQKPAPEFSFLFAGFSSNTPDGGDATTTFGLGEGQVAVAFYLTEMIAIEPSLVYAQSSVSGSDAASTMGLQVAVPIYFSRGWGKAGGLFVAPHIGMNRFDGGPGDAVSQNHFGASVGTKIEVSDDIRWRVQAYLDMGMENEDDFIPSYTEFGVAFGMSVFLP